MRFLCDEMLRGLARWLRAAGYDTSIATVGAADRDLLAQAVAEGRILLSRDRRLLEHRGAADHAVLLESEGIEGWAREMSARLAVNWNYRPFSRCLTCNTPLRPIDAGAHALPEGAVRAGGPLHWCPRCDQVFWQGGHVRRMRARLERFAASDGSRVNGGRRQTPRGPA